MGLGAEVGGGGVLGAAGPLSEPLRLSSTATIDLGSGGGDVGWRGRGGGSPVQAPTVKARWKLEMGLRIRVGMDRVRWGGVGWGGVGWRSSQVDLRV